MNSFIWTIDRILAGTTIAGQSGLESNDNEEVLRIPQRSRTKASPPDDFMQ